MQVPKETSDASPKKRGTPMILCVSPLTEVISYQLLVISWRRKAGKDEGGKGRERVKMSDVGEILTFGRLERLSRKGENKEKTKRMGKRF